MIAERNIADLDRAVAGFPHRSPERAAIVRQYAAALNTTVQTLYIRLRKHGGPVQVHYRKMSPDLREIAIAVAAAKSTEQEEVERITGTQIILDSLYGPLVPGNYSTSQVNRAIKQLGLLLPHPTVLVEPEYANQVWHMDFSVSSTCLLMPDNETIRIATTRERKTTKKLRQHLEAQRIMIGLVVDGYSRVALARYIPTLGESTPMAINFLKHAMSQRPGERNPLGGIPDKIYSDNGSWAKTQMFATFLGSYGIAHQTIAPGRKWENGKAEVRFRDIKKSVEALLSLRAGQDVSVEEIGAMLDDLMARRNESNHPVHSGIRQELYATSLRQSPPRYLDPQAKPEYRQESYKVPPTGRIKVGDTVYYVGAALAGERIIATISPAGVAIDDPYTGIRRRVKPYIPNVMDEEKHMIPATSARREMYKRRGMDQFGHRDKSIPITVDTPFPRTHSHIGAPQEPGDILDVADALDNIFVDDKAAIAYISTKLPMAVNQYPNLADKINMILAANGRTQATCDDIVSKIQTKLQEVPQ